MMKCERYHDLFASSLDCELNSDQQSILDTHLASCEECRQEFAAMSLFWNQMALLKQPEPSPDLDTGLVQMLADYKRSMPAKTSWLTDWWQRQPSLPLAYFFGLVVLCFGFASLEFKGREVNQNKDEKALVTEIRELKQTMALALLENPSASERMRAVSYSSELKNADQHVISALLATLNNDPNVNVRLRTLDALSVLAKHPEVRAGLVLSIEQQDSPIMQSAIADLMLKLQEKKSVKSFRQLLKQKDLDPQVREKLSETIMKLI